MDDKLFQHPNQNEPIETQLNSLAMAGLDLDILAMYKKIMANPKIEYIPLNQVLNIHWITLSR